MRRIKVDAGGTKLMLVMLMTIYVVAKPCIFTSPLTLQLLLEYAEWRSWDQVVLFDNVSPFSKCVQFINQIERKGNNPLQIYYQIYSSS